MWCAFSTIRVLALEISRPVSTMVVQTKTSYSRSQNACTVFSSSHSFIWCCAMWGCVEDGCTAPHVVVAVPGSLRGLCLQRLIHLPVRNRRARFGNEVADFTGLLFDVRDLVVDKEGLAIAQQLAANCGGDLLVFVGADISQHRVAVFRRGEDGGHFANARHRHLQ